MVGKIVSVGMLIVIFTMISIVLFTRFTKPTGAAGEIADREFVAARVGDTVCRPDGHPWTTEQSGAFVIVGSSTCGACSAAKPLAEQIYEYATQHNIPVYYIIPDKKADNEGAEELRKMGRTVFRVDLRQFGLVAIPAFVRLDGRGGIQSTWTGSIALDRQPQILESVLHGSSLETYRVIPESEVPQYYDKPDAQVVGFSAIGGGREKIIPAAEFSVRASYELDAKKTTVIDCATSLRIASCQTNAMVLAKDGYNVVVSGLPMRHSSCE